MSAIGIQAQQAHYRFSANCEKAYEQLLELDFDSARMFILKEKQSDPQNLVPWLLENYDDFLNIVLFENQELFKTSEDRKKERLDLWKTGPKDSPWYFSGQAQIKLQWAFCRVLFDDYFAAATEINSAYHLLEQNKEKFPEFLEDNMGIGILHAMIGVVPDPYQWGLELFGFYGTIEQGVEEVRQQLQHAEDQAFQQEALFYFTFLRLNLQSDVARSTELLHYYENPFFKERTEKSPLLSFSKAIVLMRSDNDTAIHHLSDHYQLYKNVGFYYPVFLLGQAYLRQLSKDCEVYLKEYLQNYPGNNFKKTALQRLAWWELINNNKEAYIKIMDRINEVGHSLLDSDKAAAKEARMAAEGIFPNPVLLEARILFDGHYHQQALDALMKVDKSDLNKESLLEYHYRMGRVYHEMGGLDMAIEAYHLAVEEGENSDRYFAGKAAQKMGEIEEQRGHFTEAQRAYEKCLELDFTEYRRGIRAKAKAGLQRIKDKN